MTPAQLIATEARLVQLWDNGEINSLCHFDGSTDGELEIYLCRLFEHAIKPGDWILASHRAHYVFHLHRYWTLRAEGRDGTAAYELSAQELCNSVLAGRSMFNYSPRFIQSAIVAGLCGTAAGLALAVQQRGTGGHIWHFSGDGSVDQGSFFEAVNFVHGRDLPATFVVLSNNRQCGVTRQQRQVKDWNWPPCVVWHEYSPSFPHAGSGGPKFTFKSQTPAFVPAASTR